MTQPNEWIIASPRDSTRDDTQPRPRPPATPESHEWRNGMAYRIASHRIAGQQSSPPDRETAFLLDCPAPPHSNQTASQTVTLQQTGRRIDRQWPSLPVDTAATTYEKDNKEVCLAAGHADDAQHVATTATSEPDNSHQHQHQHQRPKKHEWRNELAIASHCETTSTRRQEPPCYIAQRTHTAPREPAKMQTSTIRGATSRRREGQRPPARLSPDRHSQTPRRQ